MFPFSNDRAAVGLAKLALAVRQVCAPLSLVPAAVWPALVADALLHVADPLAKVLPARMRTRYESALLLRCLVLVLHNLQTGNLLNLILVLIIGYDEGLHSLLTSSWVIQCRGRLRELHDDVLVVIDLVRLVLEHLLVTNHLLLWQMVELLQTIGASVRHHLLLLHANRGGLRS